MTLLDKTNTLVIVPAFNEQDSIFGVIEEIKATGFPFVVVDDGSTDETRKRAIKAGARTISMPFNSGVGGSVKCGMKYALERNYEAVIQCDADGQHSPHYFDDLVFEANQRDDVIIVGSRLNDNKLNMKMGFIKSLGSKLLTKTILNHETLKVTDPTSGNRITKKSIIKELLTIQPNYYLADTIIPLVIARLHNLTVSEIPVVITKRIHGDPRTTLIKSLANFIKLFYEYKILKNLIKYQKNVGS
jgi:glycosyltransferase involved in cell wall biosynthesis